MTARMGLLVALTAACGSHESAWDASGASGGDYTAASDASGQGQGQAGELTAGAWDDNLNFDWFEAYLEAYGQMPGAPALDLKEREAARDRFAGDRLATVDLDVALLIDTTGSMSDELSYLTAEIERIADVAPDASIRWGLVVYRDQGDAYVTRSEDFTQDLAAFRAELASHSADGGGDWPEASPEGLDAVLDLSWRSEPDVARLAFWVADAPHHTDRSSAITDALRRASDDEVHLYPVAASGTDELAELTMRSAAQLTGGRYLFLTDDSGIGNAHEEPTIPCYFVTTLRDAMVRMVEIERSGVYVEPDPDEVIRTGGDPQNGSCLLEDGEEVIAF